MNAIIMAAGLGSRFKEVTKVTPKALLPINEKPNLERTIEYLIASKKVNKIYILVGYLKEKFDYLSIKYNNVYLISNKFYEEYNSIYTFSLALPYFSDSFVIDGDSVFASNIFSSIDPNQSTYYTLFRNKNEGEWHPILKNNKVVGIETTKEKVPTLSGISFWKASDCQIIKKNYEQYSNVESIKNPKLYWDDIPRGLLSILNVTSKLIEKNSILEMDNVEEYEQIQDILSRN